MQEVEVPGRDVNVLAGVVGSDRVAHLLGGVVERARAALGDGRVLNVNSTSTGGGVAELLRVLLAYTRFTGIDGRWLVLDAGPPFFALTKRVHNHLYGFPGDGGPLGAEEHAAYEATSRANAADLATMARPGDVLVLHDPQTAGLAHAGPELGLPVVWRCHVGIDEQNEYSRQGWDFLRPYLEPFVDQYVFTLAKFAPDWIPADRLSVVPPSIDPFAAKNVNLTAEQVQGVLATTGLVAGEPGPPVAFTRPDGTVGHVHRPCGVVRDGGPPDPSAPLVVQVSRWDFMKDMPGVMRGFADQVRAERGAHLVLAGPSVEGVHDDPEGAEVYAECIAQWQALDPAIRARVHLATLPMEDVDENGVIVNALQRHAAVVTQKSIAEGFGLTVTEALYKGRPVVATAVGGIVDQIVDGVTGVLLDDPFDLAAFGQAVDTLLADPERADRMGEAARADATARFLADRHLMQWVEVLEALGAHADHPAGPRDTAGP